MDFWMGILGGGITSWWTGAWISGGPVKDMGGVVGLTILPSNRSGMEPQPRLTSKTAAHWAAVLYGDLIFCGHKTDISDGLAESADHLRSVRVLVPPFWLDSSPMK